jgi:hypothetical protein
MKKTLPLLLVLSLLLMAFPATAFAAETVEDPYEAYLRLGKPRPGVDQIIGGVQVWNDAETLYVQFEAYEPYCITGLHLQVANDLISVPDVEGNPDNGRPAINERYDDCLDVRGPFEYDMSDNGWFDGSNLVIAAHVDVGEEECTVNCVTITPAPYGAFVVTDFEQGLRKDGTVVSDIRSNPDSVLVWDDLQLPDAFFSLGLGGWIEVEFDKPIANGDGDDVLIVEDTWGTYVAESAAVYASNDGVNWVYLGEANNETRDLVHPWQTVSSFDLGAMDDVRFIRVEDTTPVETMPDDGDGYDLNSIQALQDYEECTETCEVCDLGRAWAGNKLGSGAAFSRWVRYVVDLECPVQAVILPAQQETTDAPGQAAEQPQAIAAPEPANADAGPQQQQRGR